MKYVVLVLLFLSSFAHASDWWIAKSPFFSKAKDQNSERLLAFSYPQLLLDRGIEQIYGIDLKKLKKDFNKVTVFENRMGNIITAEGRTGSLYGTESKSVLINIYQVSELNEDEKKLLYLHEFLGALGFIDDNYELSICLTASALDPEFQLSTIMNNYLQGLSVLKRTFSKGQQLKKGEVSLRFAPDMVAAEGGVTGVGGGGDPAALTLKLHLIQKACSQKDMSGPNLDAFLLFLFDVAIYPHESTGIGVGQPYLWLYWAKINNKTVFLIKYSRIVWERGFNELSRQSIIDSSYEQSLIAFKKGPQ